ncbi:MAG: amidohydrolase family protein, partial [Microthrixaceae bacterium]
MNAASGLLIAGGSVVVGDGSARTGPTDVYLEGDLIVAVGDDARARAHAAGPAVEHLDATGLTVMPGLIDAHCHITFGEPASN